MAGKKIAEYTVGVGFQVDPKGLQQAFKDLKSINYTDMMNIKPHLNGDQLRAEMDKIRKLATATENALIQSFNPKLNTYSFKAFNEELQKSGRSAQLVVDEFSQLGSKGQAALAQMAKTLMTTNVQLKEAHSWLDKMGTTIANTVRWQAATKVIQSMTGAIQQGYYFTKDLDKSLNDIRIVTDKSAESMDKFAQKAMSAAKALGKSTTDYTNASLIFYQQGLTDKEVEARTETTLKAANVTGQSASAVSQELTAVWNGYQIGVEGTEEAVDKLAAVAATSASNLEELSTAMSKVAATANMTGVDIDQLNAQISTIISVTRQAPETVGTALKTIYARISDLKLGGTDEDGLGLGDVSGTLHDLGIEVLDSTGDLRDMGTVIEEIAEKWNYLTRAERTALAEVMGGKRQYTNLVALFDNWDKYTKALDTSRNSLGTLQKQQDTFMDSTKAHLQQLNTAKEQLYAAIWDDDTIKEGSDALRSMVESVTRIITVLGGGKGLIANVISLGTMFASKQIGQGIATFVNNFNAMTQNANAIKEITNNARQFATLLNGNKQTSQVEAYANQTAQAYQNFNLGLISKDELESQIQFLDNQIQKQIELNAILEKNQLTEQKFADAMDAVGAKAEFSTTNMDENRDAVKAVVQQLQEEVSVYKQLDDVLNHNNEATTENITVSNSLTDTQKERVNNLKNEVAEIEKEEAALNKYKEQLGALKAAAESYEKGNTKRSTVVQAFGAMGEKTPKANKDLYEKIKKIEKDYTDASNKLAERRANAQKQSSELSQDAIEAQKNASELSLQDYKDISADLVEQQSRTFSQIQANKQLITQSLSQGITGTIAGMASLEVQVNNLSNAFSGLINEEMTFGDFIKTMLINLPLLASSYNKITQSLGLLTNAQKIKIQNDALSVAYDKQKEITTKSLDLLEKAETGTKIENAEVSALSAAMTKADAEAKAAEAASSEAASGAIAKLNAFLITHKAIMLGVVGAVAASIAAYKIYKKSQKEAAEATLKANKKEIEKAKEKADISKEEFDNVNNLQKAYLELQKTAKEQEYSDRKLEQASYDLLTQYGLEEAAVDVLIGKYLNYQEAIKGVTQAKQDEASQDADDVINKSKRQIKAVITSDQKSLVSFKNLRPGESKRIANQKDLVKEQAAALGISETEMYSSEEGRQWLENFVLEEKSAKHNTAYIDRLNNNLKKTQEYYDNIVEASKTQADIEKTQTLSKAGENISNGSYEERIKQYQELRKQGIDETDISNLANNYDDLDGYIKSFLENDEHLKDLNISIKDLTLEQAQALQYNIEHYGRLRGTALQTLTDMSMAVGDYNTELTNSAIAFEALSKVSADSKITSLKDVFEKDTDKDAFVKFLQNNNLSENDFLNTFSIEAQINTINSFYTTSLQNLKATNEEIERTNTEIDKQIGEVTNKIKEEENKLLNDTEKELRENIFTNIANTITDGYYNTEEGKAFVENLLSGVSSAITEEDVIEMLSKPQEFIEKYMYAWGDDISVDMEILRNNIIENFELPEINFPNWAIIESYKQDIEVLKKSKQSLDEVTRNFNGDLLTLKNTFDAATKSVDNIQSAYNSLANVVDTYNENGYITIDQVQELVTMDAEYLKYLELENDQMQVDTNSMNALLDAKVNMMRQQIINTAYTALEALEAGKLADIQDTNIYANILQAETEGVLTEALKQTADAVHAKVAALKESNAEMAARAEYIETDMQRRLDLIDKYVNTDLVVNRSNKAKEEEKDLVEAELDIYHDINIELKKIEREIDRINDKREKLLGQDLYNSYSQELGALEAQEDALKRLQNLQKKDAADKRAELAANGVMFDANGEVSNYNAIKQKWADQVNANPDNEALSKRRDELEELLSGYEELWDEKIPDTVDKLTDVANAKIEAAVNRFNLHMDVTLDLTEMKRAFNEFRRDFIDKTRSDDFSHFVEVLTDNMKLSYKAMDENVKHVNEIQAEIEKIRAGQNSQIYGDNLAKAVEDLENYNEKLKDEMKSVTESLTSANEKYAESIDKLTEAYAKQQEYLEKLSQNYEDNAKLMQLLYGENRANSSVAGMLDQQANVLATSAQKYRAEADRYEAEIAKIQAQLADGNLTTETRQALEEEFQTLQDAALEAINNAASASVAAIEKANEAFETTVKGSTYDMATKLLGEDFDTFKADWEATQHYAELYYDDINKVFEVQKLSNKYQKTLNELTGTAQAKLREAYDAELEHLREKDKLTKYDIERAQKKYDLLVAQIALEEAQQNKNTLQLVRDSQGNYNYQYTADASAVADAQEKVDNLQQELYNLDQEAWKDNTEAIMSETETISDKVTESYVRQNQQIKKVQDNENLSEEEKLKKIAEITDAETNIRQKYYDKLNALTRERVDIAKHAEEDTKDIVEDYAIELEDNYMPRLFATWEDTNNLIGEDGERVAELINQSQQTIGDKNDVVTKLIEDNGIKAANAYQKIDDKIQKVLIPTQDAYIKKMDEEVTETAKVAKAIEELAQSYQKLYGDAGTAAEKTARLIELCKDFQKLQDKKVTYTVDYKVTGNPEAAKGMQDPGGSGNGGNLGNFTNNIGGGLTTGPNKLSLDAYASSKKIYDEKGFLTNHIGELTNSINSFYLGDNDILTYDFSGIQKLSYKALDELLSYRNNLDAMPFEKYGLERNGIRAKYSKSGKNIYIPWASFITHYMDRIGIDPLQTEGLSAIFRDIDNKEIKRAPANPSSPQAGQELSALYELMRNKYLPNSWAFKSGGYTGSWGDSGKWALLHQKELVLNSVDTANLLETIKYQREISQMQMAAAATSEKTPSSMTVGNQLDQNVYIEAHFPGVQNSSEIEAALNNLVNAAAQRTNSNLL